MDDRIKHDLSKNLEIFWGPDLLKLSYIKVDNLKIEDIYRKDFRIDE